MVAVQGIVRRYTGTPEKICHLGLAYCSILLLVFENLTHVFHRDATHASITGKSVTTRNSSNILFFLISDSPFQ